MKTHTQSLRLRASVLAVHGALAIMASTSAHAETDPAVLELTQPKSSITLGTNTVGRDSAKANEFNGRRAGDTQVDLGFELLGGGAYDSNDATRWRLIGTDLGTDSRSLSGEYGEQGRFRITGSYDELLHRSSDTYQTPYVRTGSVFSLPSTWVGLAGSTSRNITLPANAVDLSLLTTQPTQTKREKLSLGGEVQVSSRWSTFVSASREHKEGTRLEAAVVDAGGDVSSILAKPVDQDHYQYRAGANYIGDGATFQAAYDGSAFVNNISSITWKSWNSAPATGTMGTDPSNQFHKLSASGTYDLSKATKLVSSLAYGRATQNDSYIVQSGQDPTVPLVPVSSLNGVVVTKTATLKLLNKTTKDLNLSAGYKFDLRDNQTPVNTYGFYDVGAASNLSASKPAIFGTYGQNINLNANRPYSKRLNQVNLDADYKLAPTQTLNFGWETRKTDKYCNGSWYNCADATQALENTATMALRLTPTDDLSARLALTKAKRKVNYDENAFLSLVPYAAQMPQSGLAAGSSVPPSSSAYQALLSLGLTGYGPMAGFAPNTSLTSPTVLGFYFPNNNVLLNNLYGNRNRISELVGMRRYNNANRDRNGLNATSQWQATDTVELSAGLDYKRDSYDQSVYGLQKSEVWALNLEGTYAPSETFSFTGFYTFDNQRDSSAGYAYTANAAAGTNTTAVVYPSGVTCQSGLDTNGNGTVTVQEKNVLNKLDACNNWSALTVNRVDTLGLTLRKNKLMSGKLDVTGTVIVSLAQNNIDVRGGSYGTVGTTVTYIPATALPTVRTNTQEFRLNGLYRLDSKRSVRVGYSFRHMNTTDFAYEGLQVGTSNKEVLPTNEQSPSFTVQSVGVAYIAQF